MAWARVDDQWFAHRKVVGLSLAARGLWATVLSWSCAQRSPVVPEHMVAFLAGGQPVDAEVAELVEAGLWVAEDGGWRIHDWRDYQVQSLSEKRAAAGRKGAEKRWSDGSQMANGGNDDLPSMANGMAGARPGPSRPVPTHPDPKVKPAMSPPEGGDVPEPQVSDDARRLTREFAVAVKGNGHPVPKAGAANRTSWLVEMDRLLRIGPPGWDGDAPAPGEVARVISWCAADEFERANVRSVPKLRQRYSQLRLRALNRTNGNGRAPPSQRVSEFAATGEF